MMQKSVSVLGTIYKITVKKYEEEEAFKRRSICGYCDGYAKEIVICDMSTYEGWELEPQETKNIAQNETLRHEIVHAFLNESGLTDNACTIQAGWARNEEMIDWIALQGEKIYAAWQEAGCL